MYAVPSCMISKPPSPDQLFVREKLVAPEHGIVVPT
jgi:hypothetical protein